MKIWFDDVFDPEERLEYLRVEQEEEYYEEMFEDEILEEGKEEPLKEKETNE